jgi:hypothetical protein
MAGSAMPNGSTTKACSSRRKRPHRRRPRLPLPLPRRARGGGESSGCPPTRRRGSPWRCTFDDRDGWIWFDGKLVPWREANVHVLTHALHYASSVFEGQRAYNGGEIFKLTRA